MNGSGEQSELPHAPGRGMLSVVRAGPRSVVSRAYATSPLRWLTPRNHGTAAWVYAATYGGGLVGGDRLRVDVAVGPDATAVLSTQASTKVYRSPRGTSVELAAVVAGGGLLIMLPDPVVSFADSTYDQDQRFELEAAAGLLLVDWLSSGRKGAGERWAFDRYSSRLAIRREGRLILFDALSLAAEDGELTARMGRFDVVCLVALLGPHLRLHAERALSRVAALPVERQAHLLLAASPIASEGCLLRIGGVSMEGVVRALRDYLSFVPALLGDDPWARKW